MVFFFSKLISIIIFVIQVIIILFYIFSHSRDSLTVFTVYSPLWRIDHSPIQLFDRLVWCYLDLYVYVYTRMYVYKFWPNIAWSAMNSITKLYWTRFFYIYMQDHVIFNGTNHLENRSYAFFHSKLNKIKWLINFQKAFLQTPNISIPCIDILYTEMKRNRYE